MQLSVSEIWRYPVKSFAGEKLTSTPLLETGIPYDRHWAIRDDATGELLGGRSKGELMLFSAAFCEPPNEDRQIAEIRFPDGTVMRTDDARIDQRLSQALERRVSLSAVRHVSDTAYYKRPQSFEFTPEITRRSFGLEAGEPLTDLSGQTEASADYIKSWQTYRTRPGTHFDTSTLHILTEASLRYMRTLLPEADICVRRFRPNIVVADSALTDAPIEFDWVGHSLAIGSSTIDVTWETVRCIMTTRAQDGLPKVPLVLRALVKNTKQNLGVCAEVRNAGEIAIGDPIRLEGS